jgi:hypothetical protein
MKEPDSWQALFPKFPETQISVALEILLATGKGLRKINASEREDKVTERLLLRIKQNPLFRSANLDIDPQYPVYDPQALDSELRGIPDLAFRLLYTPKPVPYFAVEAKRLRFIKPNGQFDTGNSEYVTGRQGMRCFTDERYAEGLNAGAMLGYVYDGDIDSATNGINLLIAKHALRLKCRNPHELVASNLPKPSSEIDETIHALKGRDFRIFHIFLEV